MDYTKYALKSAEELDCMMAGKDNFFVVACNKCCLLYTSDAADE